MAKKKKPEAVEMKTTTKVVIPRDKLSGTFSEHLELLSNAKSALHRVMGLSKFWKALYDHAGKRPGVFDHPKGYLVMSYRGTGLALRFVEAHMYAGDIVDDKWTPSKVFSLKVEIEYVHESNTGYEDAPTKTKTFYLSPPVELMDNFTKEAFDKWAEEVVADRRSKSVKTAKEQLETLKEDHPELFE